MMAPLAKAGCLVIRAPHAPAAKAGSLARCCGSIAEAFPARGRTVCAADQRPPQLKRQTRLLVIVCT